MTDDSSKGYGGPSNDERLVRECEKGINTGQHTLNKGRRKEGLSNATIKEPGSGKR